MFYCFIVLFTIHILYIGMFIKFFLIFLSILSFINVFTITNLSPRTEYVNDLFYHKEGSVCPFGVIVGKLMIFFTIIQIYFLYYDNYSKNYYYKFYYSNIILLFLGFLFSLINYFVLINIIPTFIFQIIILLFYSI